MPPALFASRLFRSFAASAAAVVALTTAHGAGFHITNGHVYDSRNVEFIMRGVSHSDVWFQSQTATAIPNIAATGANCVRIVLGNGVRWGPTSQARVTELINLCKAHGLVPILEVHDTTGWGEQAGAATLAQAAAYWVSVKDALIGQEAYVIVNIGNEPLGNNQPASSWIDGHSNAITTMRAAGLTHCIMVDAANWGQDWQGIMRTNAATVFNADPLKNVVFSVHMYEVYGQAATVTNYLNAFVTAGLPLVVGEFAAEHNPGQNVDEATIMSTCETLGLGYIGWSWSGNGGGLGALDIAVNFNPATLTTWGNTLLNGANGIAATSLPASVFGAPPAITAQPASAARLLTDTDKTFTVATTGETPVTVQWQESQNGGTTWSDLTADATYVGVSSPTLTITSPPFALNGFRYRAVATNGIGAPAISDPATLSVHNTTITLSDLHRTYTGAALTPTVATTPGGVAVPLTFDGSATAPSAVGAYAILAAVDTATNVGLATATFEIAPALALSDAGPFTTTTGNTTTFSVAATGGTSPTYQWQRQAIGAGTWTNIAGATSATLTIGSTQRFDRANYRAVVTANQVSATSAAVTLTPTAAAPNTARLLNLSTRGLATAGAGALFPGFVVEGAGTKQLLIRAVGPTLALPPIGLTLPLAPDPRLVLKQFNFTTQLYEDLTTNDDWQSNANSAQIAATTATLGGFALLDSMDAAVLVDLAAGQYAVVANDKNDTAGIAIVELYDADPGSPGTRLINISNRGFAGVGDEVMIPGFVVSAEGPKTVLVRVIGPTLVGYGVGGTMVDPKLTIYSGQTALMENDNWSDNPDFDYTAQIAQQVTAFPLPAGSADAAFVVTLAPGSYTVVGSSATPGGTGIVLVELYVVP